MWIGHPDPAIVAPNFWYNDGQIYRESLDNSTLTKMIEIARKLNARVIGDDEEEYDEVEGNKIQVRDWTEPSDGS